MKKVWFCNQRCTLLKIQNFQQDLHGTTWHLHIHFASYAYAQLVKPLVFTLVSRPCWQYICCQRTCAPQTVVFPLLFLSVHEAPEDWEPTGNQSGGQQIVPFLPACIVMTWSHECMTSKILVFVTLIGDCYVGPCTPNSNFYWWMWGEGGGRQVCTDWKTFSRARCTDTNLPGKEHRNAAPSFALWSWSEM